MRYSSDDSSDGSSRSLSSGDEDASTFEGDFSSSRGTEILDEEERSAFGSEGFGKRWDGEDEKGGGVQSFGEQSDNKSADSSRSGNSFVEEEIVEEETVDGETVDEETVEEEEEETTMEEVDVESFGEVKFGQDADKESFGEDDSSDSESTPSRLSFSQERPAKFGTDTGFGNRTFGQSSPVQSVSENSDQSKDSQAGKSSRQSSTGGSTSGKSEQSTGKGDQSTNSQDDDSLGQPSSGGSVSEKSEHSKGKQEEKISVQTSPGGSAPTKSEKSKDSSKSSRKSPQSKPIPTGHVKRTQSREGSKVRQCKSIAILGTMSDAGKSIVAAGLCRILSNGGIRVAPFKGQNMSNNASPALLPALDRRDQLYKSLKKAVGGKLPKAFKKGDQGYGEIGTAQSLQAEACRQVPRVEMNPVLLKSGGKNEKGEYLCSVIVLGKQVARETYGDLGKRTTSLRQIVLECHTALAEATKCDVIVLEGAGSCTELNLITRDIVNLPLVRSLQCPWLLVANIDCGGVFAQIVGTKMCVSPADWSRCVGVIVNKLRGEAKYFEPGPRIIEQMVDKPVFVVPFLDDLNLPEEDGLGIERRVEWETMQEAKTISEEDKQKPLVVVVAYPHTAIADDLCPIERDTRFRVQWRRRRLPRPYPHTAAVILPGSRLTRLDLKWLHDSGWGAFLKVHVAAGGVVLGLCGGYQMLGWSVEDPGEVEGAAGAKQGLGLLPIRTKISPPECKVVVPRKGRLHPSKIKVEGFELHCGRSEIISELVSPMTQKIHPLLQFENGKPEGMCSGRVRGTYLHGILSSPKARAELLVPELGNFPEFEHMKVEDPLDRFAKHLEACGLDFATVQKMIGQNNK